MVGKELMHRAQMVCTCTTDVYQSCLQPAACAGAHHRKMRTQTWALTGTARVCICAVGLFVRVRGGTTSSVVPPRTRMGRRTVQVRTWVVPVGARVRVRFFLCMYTLS